VIQMTFGLFLSLLNHIYFKKTVSVINEFIPQFIFLMSIFGYLTVMIIFKWCSNWDYHHPPSLLNMLINMFLSPGAVPESERLYPHQEIVQLILLAMALLAVPWMLLVKPLWLRHKHKKQTEYATIHADEDHDQIGEEEEEEEEEEGGTRGGSRGGDHGGHGEAEEEFDFGEEMVHQVIHTIEFCLGAVSNTASYLRLWALSLAHAQLSDVLWSMTLGKILVMENVAIKAIGLFVAFSAWFFLTIGILLIMEGLSAFLHALRLHWVEFDGKFYAASGYLFKPFAFKRLLKGDDD
jgi:V-type H+-transporting ATPase subunit a